MAFISSLAIVGRKTERESVSYRSELIQVAAVALAAVQVVDQGTTHLDSPEGARQLRILLREVGIERERQELKWGPQTHNRAWWLTILAEEFGEAARAVLEDSVQCPPTKK